MLLFNDLSNRSTFFGSPGRLSEKLAVYSVKCLKTDLLSYINVVYAHHWGRLYYLMGHLLEDCC